VYSTHKVQSGAAASDDKRFEQLAATFGGKKSNGWWAGSSREGYGCLGLEGRHLCTAVSVMHQESMHQNYQC
jgi:hypothetical protein